MGLEFATAAVHNSYYFHKFDNVIQDKEHVAGGFEELARRLLDAASPKSWFRAWFNMGLANYVRGGDASAAVRHGHRHLLRRPVRRSSCRATPWTRSMGSLKEQTFEEIWDERTRPRRRARVAALRPRCWMIGSVAPAMKRTSRCRPHGC